MAEDNDIIVGIDLGTTNSLVAVCDEAGPRVLHDADGEALVPSVLMFSPNQQVTIGQQAKVHAVENPLTTVFSVKRLMGRGYDELSAAGELSHLPFKVVQLANDTRADTTFFSHGPLLLSSADSTGL